MDVTLTISKKKYKTALIPCQTLRMYAVPTDYSEDGLCECVWGEDQLEPVPACDSAGIELLADISAVWEDGKPAIVKNFLSKGVTCA